MNTRPARNAFTLVEVLVVIAIIAVLMGIFLPMAEKARHKAYISTCANNLRQIGQALQLYANGNRGNYPRTRYVPDAPYTYGTGATSPDAFSDGTTVAINDVTASVWLLARVTRTPTSIFVCNYGDENDFVADKADPQVASNFTDWKKNLGYSFASAYPGKAAEQVGYRLSTRLPPDFAVAADLNPGKTKRANPAAVAKGAPKSVVTRGNSLNHEQDGQNVLYGDGHVTFQLTPLAGVSDDNIYVNTAGSVQGLPGTATDTVLLPDGDD